MLGEKPWVLASHLLDPWPFPHNNLSLLTQNQMRKVVFALAPQPVGVRK